mmetsp:Transcript_77442/g.214139  ORF Transcript_77442/g.214139 Transcript_77442/m.214139 type:complete len:307 (+) Transcript_77442:190-1110(+)
MQSGFAEKAETVGFSPKVVIIGARGLREADWAGWGRSERYCVCEVLGKPRSRVQTALVDDTQNAVWNYKAEVKDYAAGDSLTFTVMVTHHEWKKWQVCLGKASLTSGDLTVGFDGELPLEEAGKDLKAYLHVRVEVCTEQPPLRLSDALDRLHETIDEEEEEPPDWVHRTPVEASPSRTVDEARAVVPCGVPAKPPEAHSLVPNSVSSRTQDGSEFTPLMLPSILEDCLSLATTQRHQVAADPDAGTGASGAAAPPKAIYRNLDDLPQGWEAEWNTEHQRYYFYHHELGTSSWLWPETREDVQVSM